MAHETAKGPNRLPWPPIIYLGAIVVGAALQSAIGAPPLPGGVGRQIVGGMLAVIGTALGIGAVVRFKGAGTPVDPTAQATTLVTTGLYRFSRNPMYVGATLLGVGIGLAGDWPFVALAALAMPPLLTVLAIRREERWLEARFGDEYRAYRTRVRRWL